MSQQLPYHTSPELSDAANELANLESAIAQLLCDFSMENGIFVCNIEARSELINEYVVYDVKATVRFQPLIPF